MTKEKTYLFSNFSYEFDKDNLEIDQAKNIKLDNGKISTWNTFDDILNIISNESVLGEIITNNQEILSIVTRYIPYEFYNTDSGSFEIRLFVLTETNDLYELNETNIFSLVYSFNENKPDVLHDKNDLYFIFNGTYLLVENNNEIVVGTMPNIASFCRYKNVLFFTIKNNPFRLFYSDIYQLKNLSSDITQYSYQDIDYNAGDILSLKNLSDKIYIVCQHSIFKFNPQQFTYQLMINFPFKIYKNTINIYNDNIVFYSSAGVYCFDETSIKPILKDEINFTKNAKSFIFNDKYYIFSEDFKNILYEINITDKTYIKIIIENLSQIYYINTHSFYNLCFNILTHENNYKNITTLTDGHDKLSQLILFKPFDFNSNTLKQISNIKIIGQGNYTISIKSNHSDYTCNCIDTEMLSNINLFGTHFVIKIESEQSFNIQSFLVDVKFLES